MQKCSECAIDLNEKTAYKKTETRWQSKCRNCFNRYCNERWKKRKLEAIEYKGGKCETCGYNKCANALEFHHLDPSTKDAEWVKIRLWKWKNIKKELDKCICLCANCHREIHEVI
jgi:hypothetical protein